MGRSGRRVQQFQQFVVRDDACGMKVGTDALILGAWAGESMTNPTQILDVGTGSGILALMLAQRFPSARVDAVELEPDAAAQAIENAAQSPFADHIVVHSQAVQAWEGTPCDLVVCNPPFFHDHPKSIDRKRNLARHDDSLPLTTLFKQAKRVLKEGGELAFVFPSDRDQEVLALGKEAGMCALEHIQLRANPAHDVVRSLWSWRCSGRSTASSTEVRNIEDRGHQTWAPWLSQRLSDFLLPGGQQPST
jgi:tRNA1Val (adenine37-N6)-methyltransferase